MDTAHTATEKISDLLLTLIAIAKDSFEQSEKFPEECSFSMSQEDSYTQADSFSQIEGTGEMQS